MDLDKQLLGAKVKIKTWEKQFIRLNLRVPESADIKTAPADIRGKNQRGFILSNIKVLEVFVGLLLTGRY